MSCGTHVTNCGFGQLVARPFWYIRKIRHLSFLVSILPASISIFNYLKWRQRKGTTKLQNRSSYQNKCLLIFSTRFIWLHFCFRCRRVTKETPLATIEKLAGKPALNIFITPVWLDRLQIQFYSRWEHHISSVSWKLYNQCELYMGITGTCQSYRRTAHEGISFGKR